MAIRTKEELLDKIASILDGRDDDVSMEILEDVSDTFDALSSTSGEDWKVKYEENDREWRDRYKKRFLQPKEQDELQEMTEEKKALRYEELFKED